MESRLEAYRAKKRKALEEDQKREKYWDLVTFASLRRRIFGDNTLVQQEHVIDPNNLPPTPSVSSCSNVHDNNSDELEKNKHWDKLDVAILAVKGLLWLCLLALFVKIEFAAVYLATSAFALIYLNLGNDGDKRKKGEDVGMSAYSVFNPGFESIDGTLTAQHFERDLMGKRQGAGATGN